MKLIGLCSFYDESPTWLAINIAGAARLVDHIVFVDGAYFLYDKDGASSGPECHDAIARACLTAGVGYTLHVPDTCWMGNEVEKRAFMFQLAEQLTTDEDYYVVIDGDMMLTKSDKAVVKRDLAETDFDVYEVDVLERYDWNSAAGALVTPGPGAPSSSTFRFSGVYRAIRGLTVRGAHYLYMHPDADSPNGWRVLWGPSTEYVKAPTGLLQVQFEHWSKFRPFDRREAANSYYQIRDSARVERTSINHIETLSGEVTEI